MSSAKIVTLLNTANDTTHKFDIKHAEKILRFPNNGGWELKDSKYQYSIKDGIRGKPSSGDTKEPKGKE